MCFDGGFGGNPGGGYGRGGRPMDDGRFGPGGMRAGGWGGGGFMGGNGGGQGGWGGGGFMGGNGGGQGGWNGGGPRRDDLMPDRGMQPRYDNPLGRPPGGGGGGGGSASGLDRGMQPRYDDPIVGRLPGGGGGGGRASGIGPGFSGDNTGALGYGTEPAGRGGPYPQGGPMGGGGGGGNMEAPRQAYGEYRPRENLSDGQNAFLQSVASSGIEGMHNFAPMAAKIARKAGDSSLFDLLTGEGGGEGYFSRYGGGGGGGGSGGSGGGGSGFFGAPYDMNTLQAIAAADPEGKGLQGGANTALAQLVGYGTRGASFGGGMTSSNEYRDSMAEARKAADLAHRQNLFAQRKGNPYATDFDYAQLAGMKPREAFRYMQPSPPPRGGELTRRAEERKRR